jgi:hypothetical protein
MISNKLPHVTVNRESKRTETDNINKPILNKQLHVLFANFTFVSTMTVEYKFDCSVYMYCLISCLTLPLVTSPLDCVLQPRTVLTNILWTLIKSVVCFSNAVRNLSMSIPYK